MQMQLKSFGFIKMQEKEVELIKCARAGFKVLQKLLTSWDFHTRYSLVQQNGMKKHPVSGGSAASLIALLKKEVKGERPDCSEQPLFTTVLGGKATQNAQKT